MIDTHIMVLTVWQNVKKQNKPGKTTIFFFKLIDCIKKGFHKRVKQSMKFAFCTWVINVTPVTNPTPMSKSDK